MKILKQRKAAIAITVAVIILATFFGAHRSLASEAKKVEEQFYDGVKLEEGYTEVGIAEHLASIEDAALGMESIVAAYDGFKSYSDALSAARRELIDADGITAQYIALEKVEKAFKELYDAFKAVASAEGRDAEGAKLYADRFSGARTAIRNSSYNMIVSRFERETNGFPAAILKSITFVKPPQYFGMEG